MNEWAKRLMLSKMRVLASHGFYGMLLAHAPFAMDESCATACTDGEKIYFGPDFLDSLSDSELDFILMHEILHIALQHCFRYNDKDDDIFNIACDIVVNSNIAHSFGDNLARISVHGHPSMNKAPDGSDGYLHTAEEVYEMIISKLPRGSESDSDDLLDLLDQISDQGTDTVDDHSRWDAKKSEQLKEAWNQRVFDAASINDGSIPCSIEKLLQERKEGTLDWRSILHSFVQEEIVDYSFNPPDKRFDGGDFFLPDFNVPAEVVKNILFMVDTSGSMSDKMVLQCYDEIFGALQQFGGALEGYIGFFDTTVMEVMPFSDDNDLEIIRPNSDGNTCFSCIFRHLKNCWDKELPASVIILTDGYAPFPKLKDTLDIPVLWIINNDDVTPPWGRIARIKGEN